MRKSGVVLISIFLFAVLSAFVLADARIAVSPAEKAVTDDETFILSVEIDTDDEIVGSQFNINFNSNLLEALSTIDGGFLSKDGDTVVDLSEINNTEGEVTVVLLKNDVLNGVTGSGSAANITFKALAKNNVTEIKISDIVVSDVSLEALNISTIENGTVTIKTIHSVVINEIMQDPSAVADDDGEYFEIYNSNDFDVNIDGWTIKDNGTNEHKINNEGPLTISPNGFLILCKNNNSGENGNFECDYEYSSITLGNANDEVILLNEGLFEVDRVEYDGGVEFPDPTGASMELLSPDLDNNLGENWHNATAFFGDGDRGTPGAANIFTTGPDIKNLTKTPEPSYNDDDVTLSANITSILDLVNVSLISDFTGELETYEVTDVEDNVFSFTIGKGNFSNQQEVLYKWHSEDSGAFKTETGFESFIVQNRAPISTEIPNQKWEEDSIQEIGLNQYFSDIDNDGLTFSSTIPENVAVSINQTTGIATLTPAEDFTGINYVKFTVEDPFGGMNDSNNVTLNVTSENDDPVLAQIEDQTAIESLQFTLQLNATDSDDDSFMFKTNASFGSLNPDTGLFVFTPATNEVGTHAINFNVSDGNNGFDEQNVTLTVEPALKIVDIDVDVDGINFNNLEEGTIITARPKAVVSINATFKNQINDAMFFIDINATIDSTLNLLDTDFILQLNPGEMKTVALKNQLPSVIVEGLYDINVTAGGTDEKHIDRQTKFAFFVNVTKNLDEVLIEDLAFNPNSISCTRDTTLNVVLANTGKFDEKVELEITNSELGLNITQNATVNLTSKTNASVPISVPNGPKGNFEVNVKGKFFPLNEVSGTVNLIIENCAPALDSIADKEVKENEELTFVIGAFDFDSDALEFNSSEKDFKFTKLNDTAANASWTPTTGDIGANNIKFTVSDGTLSDSKTASITVLDVNDKPNIDSFTPLKNPKIAEDDGTKQTFTITKSDPDGGALTTEWFVDGVSKLVSSDTFIFSADGTSTGVAVLNVLANVSDSELHVTKDWNLTISDKPLSDLFDFSFDGAVESATNFKITSKGSGNTIDFGSQTVDLSQVVDLDSFILIEGGAAGIDIGNFPTLNKPATITFKNLEFDETPPIFRNTAFSVSGDDLCPSDVCTDVGYDKSTGTLTFDVTGFSVYFVPVSNNAPVINSIPITAAFISEQYTYNVIATDLDNDTLNFSLLTFPLGMTIDSSTGLIELTPKKVSTESVEVQVSDGKGGLDSQKFTLSIKERPKLEIADLDVKVGSKSDKNLKNGDKIGDEAEPGDEIEFKLKVGNLFSRDEDVEIEDVQVEITILDIDDGDDLDEESREFDIKASKDETVRLNFKVPLEVEEDTYDVEIHVEGVDTNNTRHEIDWVLGLEVEKNEHDISILRADLSPGTVTCDEKTSLITEIINLGNNDEDDASLSAVSPDLEFSFVENGIELDEGPGDKTRYRRMIDIPIPVELPVGVYPIIVNTLYDGKSSDSKTLNLNVEECEETRVVEEPVREQKPEVKVVEPVTVSEEKEVISTELSLRKSNRKMILATMLLTLLIVTAAVLFGAGMLVLKR